MKVRMKLLKDYGESKVGDFIKVGSQADADRLIEEGVAELAPVDIEVAKDVIVEAVKVAATEAVKEAAEKIEVKLHAQAKGDKPVSPFKSIGALYQDVIAHGKTGDWSENLKTYDKMVQDGTLAGDKAPTGNSGIVDSDGGFLIPDDFSTVLLTDIDNQAVLFPKTRTIPVNRLIKLPYLDNFDFSNSWAGGVTVAWGNEGATLTNSKFVLKQVELALKKIHALVTLTDEVVEDSAIGLATYTNMLASVALTKERDEMIYNGSGSGRPLGFMQSNALINVAKESGQAANTIEFKNVLNMWKQQANPNNAVWLANRDTLDQLMQLSQVVGTGGAPVMVLNAAATLPQQIFGAPILWNDHSLTLGTSGDLVCADLSAYLTATKAGGDQIKTASSIHVRFLTDEMVFKFTMRTDGQPWWHKARKPKHGNNNVSPFVALATRS